MLVGGAGGTVLPEDFTEGPAQEWPRPCDGGVLSNCQRGAVTDGQLWILRYGGI